MSNLLACCVRLQPAHDVSDTMTHAHMLTYRENARFLWRRSDPGYRAAGSPLAEAWEVGKLLYMR